MTSRKTVNLRRFARDRDCQIRAPGCSGDNATTVLAHLNGSGMGTKFKDDYDLLGAWSCHHCHDVVDGRLGILSKSLRRLYHLEGMVRTLSILIDEGVVHVGK